MRAQRITAGGDKSPFAVRVFEALAVEPIKADSETWLLPELGGPAYNVEIGDGILVRSFKLSSPKPVHGIKATQRAEVWRTLNKEPQKRLETWWAVRTPKGYAKLAAFIVAFLQEESRKLQAEAGMKCQEISTAAAAKSDHGNPPDIRAAVNAAGMTLLEKEYPQMFQAINCNRDSSTVLKAFVADCWALSGKRPDMDLVCLEKMTSDKAFTNLLNSALQKPGNPPEAWKWQLVLGWIGDGLYALSKNDLAAAMNKRTGESLNPEAWQGRVKRLGLPSSIRLGCPKK